jgi:dCTP deaminase
MKILGDTTLKTMMTEGYITGINPQDIEPASIDIPLATSGWIMRTPVVPEKNSETGFESIIRRFAMAKIDLTGGYLVPPRTTVLIRTSLMIGAPNGYFLGASAKSTTGRVDVLARTIFENSPRYDRGECQEGRRDRVFIEITPLTFPILLKPGVKLTQVRVCEATTNAPVRTDTMHIDLGGPAAGYKARRSAPPITFGAYGTHRIEDYFEPIQAKDGELILDVDNFYILRTADTIVMEEDRCGIVRAHDEELGLATWHYAGFVDCSFGLHSPSRLVLEVRPRDVPIRVVHGQPIATMDVWPMGSRPSRGYGEGRTSYQGQDLRLSRLFI